MTATMKLKQFILFNATRQKYETEESIEAAWDNDDFWEDMQDAMCEARIGQEDTDIPCGSSRHYESKSVAAKMLDGSWVGWTYWYGGGKHGEPESVPWMEDAYDLDVTQVQVVKNVFTKRGG